MTLPFGIGAIILIALAGALAGWAVYSLLLFAGARLVGLSDVSVKRCFWITVVIALVAVFVVMPVNAAAAYLLYQNKSSLNAMAWTPLLVALLADWLIIKKMLNTDMGRALVCLVILLSPALIAGGLAYASCGGQIRRTAEERACLVYMGYFAKAVETYKRDHNNQMPANMTQLRGANSQDPSFGICPLTLSAGKVTYFYHKPVAYGPGQLIACDLRANHEGRSRSVLYSDGSATTRTEEAFQKELTMPVNTDFARALRKADPPPKVKPN